MCHNLPRTAGKRSSGAIAQLVEQMTFNHWVQGSSPCGPTKENPRKRGIFYCLFFITPEFNNCSKFLDIDGSESIQSVISMIIFLI